MILTYVWYYSSEVDTVPSMHKGGSSTNTGQPFPHSDVLQHLYSVWMVESTQWLPPTQTTTPLKKEVELRLMGYASICAKATFALVKGSIRHARGQARINDFPYNWNSRD